MVILGLDGGDAICIYSTFSILLMYIFLLISCPSIRMFIIYVFMGYQSVYLLSVICVFSIDGIPVCPLFACICLLSILSLYLCIVPPLPAF